MLSAEMERQFVQAFVAKDKMQRLLDFFASERNRWKGLLELEHFHPDVIDARYAESVSRSDSSPENISRLLKQKGAPAECYVFSNCKELDRRSMQLDDAIREVHAVGIGTVVSCIPGELAFYEGELFPDEYILRRRKA
jgi:hypothetical protein